MKRQLDREERGLTERNLKKREEEIEEMKEQFEMTTESIIFDQVKRDYNDKVRPFQRKVEDKRNEDQLKSMTNGIRETENVIEVTKKQLKEGVDEK